MKAVRLKCFATVIAGQSPPSDAVVELKEGVVPFLQGNAEFGPEHPQPRFACDSAAKHALRGDVLLSVRAPVGALNVADRRYAIGRGLVAIRPKPGTDARYLWWLGQGLVTGIRALANGSTYEAVTADDVESMALPTWPLTSQQRIADFLNNETARIDGLIEKRQTMAKLLEERRTILVEGAIREAAQTHGVLPLKRAARRIEVGIVVTPSIWYADDGVIALRGVNVRRGEIVLDEVVRISDEGHLFHQKSVLRAGDVVVVRTGQAGAAAVIPRELDGANCIDLVIVRPRSVLLPKFLEFVLNSDWSQKHIQEYSVGTIQSHFNVGAMKALPVPLPTLDEQQRIVDDLTQATTESDDLRSKMWRQIVLLKERRQALITAAVTGEPDLTKGAA